MIRHWVMNTYGCDYKASNMIVSIYSRCCFHWSEELPKHSPYNRPDKSSYLPIVKTILPHFSKPHISYMIISETSVFHLTGTSQKTNLGFLTILLLGNSRQKYPFSFFLFLLFNWRKQVFPQLSVPYFWQS